MSAPQQTTLSSYPPGVSLGPQASPVRQNAPLASNNPFRTHTLSPSNTTSGGRPERPKSTNPFLDDIEPLSPQSAPSASLIDQQDMTQNTRDLFENLSLNPASKATGSRPAPPRPEKPSQNGPLKSRPPRPTKDRSEGRSNDPFNIFSDPASKSKPTGSGSGSRSRDRERRPRRNSESSVMERTPKLLDDDDERRRRERRRREREARHRDGKSRSKKPAYQLDIIDKLDVTSIYGTGMFHHDGPFDACNPHRNRKGLRAAPLQAFPKDSSNMALGGAGPNNQNIDLNQFHGRMEEGYNDFSSTRVPDNHKNEVSFDPTARIDPVHGSESMGLGTSTFLDGAPASRSAIREVQPDPNSAGGLQRKKSLAQRIRGINRPNGRVGSPQAAYRSPGNATSPRNEGNPFFEDYDDAWDKKAARINSAEETRATPEGGRVRSSSSPKQGITSLERRHTNERTNSGLEEGKNTGGGGFINRMKSLRKPLPPKRRVTDE
ncbi:Pal1 cell morphology protein-domain-containing protein [Aspergillus cavernicola]|uniref:Pal1 cell morphology protein-domain-containing protein n=1 Tax=Aspergillus cavernicola TaxID=176166 RepID=A0ABR4J5N9_9EURO